MEKYVATSYQKRLWFLYQTNQCSTAYTIGMAVMLKGRLQKDALQKALNSIVEKHAAFRSRFFQEKDRVFQTIVPKLKIALRLADANCSVKDFISSELSVPFDLENGPLIRGALLPVTDLCHVLCVTCSHIIADERSTEIILQDVSTMYNKHLASSSDVPCYASMMQLPGSVDERIQHEKAEEPQSELTFWQRNLKGIPSFCSLPTDYSRPSAFTYEGRTIRFRLSYDILLSLRKLFSGANCSLFVGLLSIFEVLLYRYTYQKDLVLGCPFSDRLKFELDDAVGFYSNTVVLRTVLEDKDTFFDVIDRTKKTTLAAYEHSGIPFEKVVDAVSCERSLDKNPLFQVMFTYNPYISREDVKFEGLETEILPVDYNTSKFDLTLFANEMEDGLELVFEYSTDLFKEERIQNLGRHYEELAKAILNDPDKKIEELEFLPQEEKKLLCSNFGRGREDINGALCLQEVFERREKEAGNAIAVSFDEEELSYSELNSRANQLAHYLRSRGVKPNDLVAILLERSLHLPVAILGTLKSGAAYVPLDMDYPSERIEFMLKDANAGVVVTHSKFADVFSNYRGEIIYLDKLDLSAESVKNPKLVNTEKDIAYVIYTSGSTGIPKGVMVEHGNVYRLMKASEEVYDFNNTDVWAWFHSYAFDFSVWEMWGAWFYGGKLSIVPYVVSRSPELLYAFLRNNKVTVLNQTPSAFKNLVVYDKETTTNLNLRYIIFGGEALNTSTLREWIKKYGDKKPKLINMYGITETTVHVTYKQLSEKDLEDNGSLIGKPLPDLEVYIMDELGQLVPVGVKGEMYVGGGGVTRGYLNREDLTKERYVAHPFRPGERIYKTGDLGRYRFDGSLEYCGRKDRQVKIRGYRIETGEIEAEILKNANVRSAYVRAIKEDGIDNLVAYIVLQSHDKDGGFEGTLKEELKKRLPSYMIPSTFIVIEELPLTTSGKILEDKLPRPGIHERQSLDEYVEAETEAEKQLVEIWKEVLKLETVGVKDNFFSLGGNSILALKMVSLLRKRYSRDLRLEDIFQYPTIKELSVCTKAFLKKSQIVTSKLGEKVTTHSLQKRFWILSRLFPNSVYNIHISWTIKGDLKEELLEKAFLIFLKKNRFLMSYFKLENDELVSYYSKNFRECFRYISCFDSKSAFDILASISGTVFDLEKGPLCIGYLIRIKEHDYIFSIVTHHIVFDGNLKDKLAEEVSEVYNALLHQKHDFCESAFLKARLVQNKVVRDEEHEVQKKYWINELSDISDHYRITPDFPPPPVSSFNGKCLHFSLSATLKDAILAIAAKEKISLFNFLLSAFQSLAICYSGGDEFIVGIPSNLEALDDNVVTAMSVNTLPIRLRINQTDTFLDVAKRVQHTVLSALQNQDIPFDEIVAALNKDFSLEHNPIFQTMFMIEFDESEKLKLDGLLIQRVELDSKTSKFDLTFLARVTDHGIECVIEYSPDLYKESTMSKFAVHFRNFLENIANSGVSGKNVFQSIVDSNEDGKLLYSSLNGIDKSLNATSVCELIENQMIQKASSTAVVFGEREVTYQELKTSSDTMMALLHKSNIKRSHPITICLERSVEILSVILGIWKYGGFYLPIDPSLPKDRISYILDDSETDVIITTVKFKHTLFENFSGHIICVDDLENISVTNLDIISEEEDLPAYMIYTSGSTGNPKGVVIDHDSLLNVVVFFTDYCKVSDLTFWLAESSISFDISILELMLPLTCGGRVYIASTEEQKDPYELKEVFQAHRITHFQATPTLLKLLMDAHWVPEKTVTLLSGGESLSYALASYFLRYIPCIINVYGPTETTIWSSAGKITKATDITIGKPIYNTYFYVLNSALQVVPIGVPGDLYIGGKGVANGYWRREELTLQKFVNNPFRRGERMYCTGDRVRCLASGELEYLGRSDSQVKLRGYRIELEEIERNIEKFSKVLVAAVNVVNLKNGSALVAYIQPKQDTTIATEELRIFLNSALPTYMIPDKIMILDSMPKLPNGKVNRRALLAYRGLVSNVENRTECDKPRNYLQFILQSVWSNVLGHSNYDINSKVLD